MGYLALVFTLFVGLVGPRFALGDDCSSFKIVYSKPFNYTNALGDEVTRDIKMVTKENVGEFLYKAVKLYGKKYQLKRDYSANKLLKLMSKQDQDFMANPMRLLPSYDAFINYDFDKFSNRDDLRKLFNACYEEVLIVCNVNRKTCEIRSDKTICQYKNYLFGDLSASAANFSIGIDVAGVGFSNLVEGGTDKQGILSISVGHCVDGGEECIKQAELIDKLKLILPKTQIIYR
jgi:hypothetical protein